MCTWQLVGVSLQNIDQARQSADQQTRDVRSKQISTFMEVDVRISEEQYQDFIPSIPSNVLHKGRSWDRLKRHQQLLKLIDPSGRRGDCAETETLDQLWTAGIYGCSSRFLPKKMDVELNEHHWLEVLWIICYSMFRGSM